MLDSGWKTKFVPFGNPAILLLLMLSVLPSYCSLCEENLIFWIGLNDRDIEGTFVTINGDPMPFDGMSSVRNERNDSMYYDIIDEKMKNGYL